MNNQYQAQNLMATYLQYDLIAGLGQKYVIRQAVFRLDCKAIGYVTSGVDGFDLGRFFLFNPIQGFVDVVKVVIVLEP